MSRRPRRNHTPAFKAKVALAAIKGDERWLSWHSSSTFTPIRSQLESAAGGRGGRRVRAGSAEPATPAVDVKSLHAKIGELTLENDFLEGALGKAGLLSAKR